MMMNPIIQILRNKHVIHTKEIVEAFEFVDRKDFVPSDQIHNVYGDYPLPIGYGQTNSQPYTVAFMLEHLNPAAGNQILDIGCGSGWTTALLCNIVGNEGFITGLERVDELVDFASYNLEKYDFKNYTISKAGTHLGIPEKRFDRILVSAAARELPKQLLEQLNVGGVMIIPIVQSIWRIEKISDSDYQTKKYPGFVFVPLVY